MSNHAFRTATFALLFALLCVPALTRVSQMLDVHSSADPSIGFSKAGGHKAPKPVVIEPHSTLIDLFVKCGTAPVRPIVDEPPTRPDVAELSGFRAPPALIL
jgi:hypothetical protein